MPTLTTAAIIANTVFGPDFMNNTSNRDLFTRLSRHQDRVTTGFESGQRFQFSPSF
jgi:hypothetical protein